MYAGVFEDRTDMDEVRGILKKINLDKRAENRANGKLEHEFFCQREQNPSRKLCATVETTVGWIHWRFQHNNGERWRGDWECKCISSASGAGGERGDGPCRTEADIGMLR
jgi:hypothetical protein